MKIHFNLELGGISSFLTILFVVLKLMDKIEWSWLWVLSPLWISAAVAIAILAIIGIVAWIRCR